MKGTKRFAPSSESHADADTNDAPFRNKKIMEGSPIDVHRAEPSNQLLTSTSSLDLQRAELSRRHVRALNSHFASWIQLQLKNHPDELWEDGVRDYLAHASGIMEKFSDVVNWLIANTAKVDDSNSSIFHTTGKKFPEAMNNENKVNPENSSVNPFSSITSFPTQWSSGLFSNSQAPAFQAPVLFGSQGSTPNNPASDAADDENDLEQPSSPSLKKTEEKGIVVVHEVKCKLYVKNAHRGFSRLVPALFEAKMLEHNRKPSLVLWLPLEMSSDPLQKDVWKDKGMGQLSIKCKQDFCKGTKESKPTIVVRNEVGKVLLNALLYPGIKTNSQKNSLVAIFHTSGEIDGNGGETDSVVARTFLIRTKTAEDRDNLATAIQEYAPSS